ncbi:MAG: hypothetical protein HXM47_04815 [Pseudoleptotrichia goodfellowii]|nr:hypothetical protein [Pseudoleptotrichia goodfellowii]
MIFNELEEEAYKKKLESVIEETEGFYNHWYADHLGYATIGFGTAIEYTNNGKMSNEKVKEMFKNVGKVIDDRTIEMARNLGKGIHDKSGNFTITKEQGVDLMYLEINTKRESIKKRLLKVYSELKQTSEEIALLSISYNTGSLGSSLSNAVNNKERVKAWFEIRYRYNGGKSRGQGLANRRYIESDTFQLFDNVYFDAKDPLINKDGKINKEKQEKITTEEREEIMNFLNSKDDKGKIRKKIAEEYELEMPPQKSVKNHKSIGFDEIWKFLNNTVEKPVIGNRTKEAENLKQRYGGVVVVKGNKSTDENEEYNG